MRAFDTATNAGAMSRSELAHLIGADTIETIAIGDGYLRSRLHIPEGARAGFEAVFSAPSPAGSIGSAAGSSPPGRTLHGPATCSIAFGHRA
jgi:hypothetical protein